MSPMTWASAAWTATLSLSSPWEWPWSSPPCLNKGSITAWSEEASKNGTSTLQIGSADWCFCLQLLSLKMQDLAITHSMINTTAIQAQSYLVALRLVHQELSRTEILSFLRTVGPLFWVITTGQHPIIIRQVTNARGPRPPCRSRVLAVFCGLFILPRGDPYMVYLPTFTINIIQMWINNDKYISSWWFQLISKILVKLDHFPK